MQERHYEICNDELSDDKQLMLDKLCKLVMIDLNIVNPIQTIVYRDETLKEQIERILFDCADNKIIADDDAGTKGFIKPADAENIIYIKHGNIKSMKEVFLHESMHIYQKQMLPDMGQLYVEDSYLFELDAHKYASYRS